MLSKVEREDGNLPPRKKAKSRLGCAAEWKVWYGKEKSYVSDIYIYIYIYIYIFLVMIIIIFKTQGPPTTISS